MLAVTMTLLTIGGHAAAGGGLPGPVGVAIVALLATGVSQVLAPRRLRIASVLGLLLAGQGLAHVVLSVTGHHATTSAGGPGAAPMLGAHVVAAIVAAVVLARSDELVDRWLTLAATVLGTPLPVLADLPRAVVRRPERSRTPGLTDSLLHHAGRRGPPARLLLT